MFLADSLYHPVLETASKLLFNNPMDQSARNEQNLSIGQFRQNESTLWRIKSTLLKCEVALDVRRIIGSISIFQSSDYQTKEFKNNQLIYRNKILTEDL